MAQTTGEKARIILLDAGIYVFILAGIVLSRYLPQFKSGEPLVWVPVTWLRMVMSMLVAFMIVGSTDFGGDEGKRKPRNFVRRAAFALSQGFMWETVISG